MSNNQFWPHAPPHYTRDSGIYMVTAGTMGKEHFFKSWKQLAYLQDVLLELAQKYEWQLQAWAVFPNHYHFIALSPDEPQLRRFIQHLHSVSARFVNQIDGSPGRRVWFNYWDSLITYETSHYARLKYVNENAVHHGLVRKASLYPWCSARWFERVADTSYYHTVNSFKTDTLRVRDDF
ncbi:transposase [Rubritalea tangerina]|uniref:Transposase n=1 Tax=Rubritalea tangerina TaxID=430798 RepID=A0ABW4ZCD2_9BACT